MFRPCWAKECAGSAIGPVVGLEAVKIDTSMCTWTWSSMLTWTRILSDLLLRIDQALDMFTPELTKTLQDHLGQLHGRRLNAGSAHSAPHGCSYSRVQMSRGISESNAVAGLVNAADTRVLQRF